MVAKIIVTALLAAMFAFAGLIKVIGVRQSLAIRDHLGVDPTQWRLIGLLELAGVAGVLAGLKWAPIGIAAAIGLTLLILGAIVFHVRASDSVADTAPAVIGLGLAVATAILQSV
jgi:DoxX-like family